MILAKYKSFFRKAAAFSMAAVILGGTSAYVLPQVTDTAIMVNAAAAAKKVKLNKSSLTLGKGENFTLKATVTPSNAAKGFKWSTSNSKVAAVKNGKVTAKNTGTAVIKVKTASGKTASCKITVKKAPTKITLSKTSMTLGVKESYTLTKSLSSGAASNKVTYSSSNKSVATVNASGLVTAKKTGTATITAKTYNGKKTTCKVTVKKAPTKITLTKSSLKLGAGETYTLSRSVPSGTASYRVTYSSSNKNVVQVGSGGKLTAKRAGTAIITAKTYNGKAAKCTVSVKAPPSFVLLNQSSIYISPNQTGTLKASISNSAEACNKYSFTSSNSNIVKITQTSGASCKFKALKAGKANITVKTFNGKTAKCQIIVRKYSNFVKLIDKMKNKSDMTYSSGSPYITSTNISLDNPYTSSGSYNIPSGDAGAYMATIQYNQEKDSITMSYMFESKNNNNFYLTAVELDFNNTYTIKPMFLWNEKEETSKSRSVAYTSQVNATKYTKNMTLPYILYEMDNSTIPQDIQTKGASLANEQLKTAMTEWDNLLYKKYSMHLSDIGFDIWK
ncbi:MAG: Ig domain-containing protein [Clostridia bacterium]|nr:Ig domain-containing protein [Clostridia bacterium]